MNPVISIPAVITATFGAVALGLGGCAGTPAIPETLSPAATQAIAMVVPARGAQIYECRAKGAGHEWAFVAPDAELLDTRGNVIGRHGAGPYWQALDGSRVNGTVKARADAPVAGAIPWLLLETKSTGPAGSFSSVTSIQRVNTVGGLVPAAPCNGVTVGTQERVHYTADYRFFSNR
jgi:hypothetical protein